MRAKSNRFWRRFVVMIGVNGGSVTASGFDTNQTLPPRHSKLLPKDRIELTDRILDTAK